MRHPLLLASLALLACGPLAGLAAAEPSPELAAELDEAGIPPVAESPEVAGKLAGVRALARAGRQDEALARIEDVIREHPRSAPAWELKGDLAAAVGNQHLAATAYREAARLEPEGGAEDKLALVEPSPITTWTLRVGGTRDQYSRDRGFESDLFAQVGYDHSGWRPAARDYGLRLTLEREDRFDAVDETVAVDGSFRPARKLNLLAGASWTPDADWHSKAEVGGGLELALVDALVAGQRVRVEALGGLRHQEYAEGRILRGAAGVRLDLPRAFALEARWLPLADNRTGSTDGTEKHSAIEAVLRTRIRAWGPAQSSVGLRQGDEVEPPLVTAKATTVFATIAIPLDRQFTLEAIGQYQDREDAFTAWKLGGALAFRF